jgi:transposase
MNNKSLFAQALGIGAPWNITSIDFSENNKKLDINIDFVRGSTFEDESPVTGETKEYKAYDTLTKTWRHLNFFQYECYLNARTPRIKREDGSIRNILPPWSGKMMGFTMLFEAFLMELCVNMPISKTSKMTNISSHKLWDMLDLYVDHSRHDEDYSGVDTVGIDETSIAKGHQYISLFVDLKKKKTIFVTEGKSNKTVIDFAEDLKNHNAAPDQIKEVSCDMSPAFIKGVKENLPNANITFDKFHILKIINEAVDKVRREESINNPILKNSRYVLLKNKQNLTKKQQKKMTELTMSKLNLKSVRAMHIRENFQEIYKSDTIKQFTKNLQKWYFWASHSKLKPMIKAAKTIKNHWDGIVRWKISQINNGILEGLNSVLQAAKRKARGYKFKHFRTMAYLLTGKLDFGKVNKFITH